MRERPVPPATIAFSASGWADRPIPPRCPLCCARAFRPMVGTMLPGRMARGLRGHASWAALCSGKTPSGLPGRISRNSTPFPGRVAPRARTVPGLTVAPCCPATPSSGIMGHGMNSRNGRRHAPSADLPGSIGVPYNTPSRGRICLNTPWIGEAPGAKQPPPPPAAGQAGHTGTAHAARAHASRGFSVIGARRAREKSGPRSLRPGIPGRARRRSCDGR